MKELELTIKPMFIQVFTSYTAVCVALNIALRWCGATNSVHVATAMTALVNMVLIIQEPNARQLVHYAVGFHIFDFVNALFLRSHLLANHEKVGKFTTMCLYLWNSDSTSQFMVRTTIIMAILHVWGKLSKLVL